MIVPDIFQNHYVLQSGNTSVWKTLLEMGGYDENRQCIARIRVRGVCRMSADRTP